MIEARGDEALAKGHKITAGNYYLRAGIYHYNAERFIQPGPEKKTQCANAYKVWHQASGRAIPTSSSSRCPTRARRCRRCS